MRRLALLIPLALLGCPGSSSSPDGQDPSAKTPPPPTPPPDEKTTDPTKTSKTRRPSYIPPPTRRFELKVKSKLGKAAWQEASHEMILTRRSLRSSHDITMETRGLPTRKDREDLDPVLGWNVELDPNGTLRKLEEQELIAYLQTTLDEARQNTARNQKCRIYLPTGGWFEQAHKITPLDKVRKLADGRSCEGIEVRAQVEGQLSTGERVRGLLNLELYRDEETKELLGLITLPPKDKGSRTYLSFEHHGVLGLKFALTAKAGRVASANPESGDAGSWLKRFPATTPDHELALLTIGAMTTAATMATARDATAPTWVPGALAVMNLTAAAIYPQLGAMCPELKRGRIVARRKEASRIVITRVPRIRPNLGALLIPSVVVDDQDHVVAIDDGQRTRLLFLERSLYDRVKVGQDLSPGKGAEIADPVTVRDANADEKQLLKKAHEAGEAAVVQ